MVKHSQTILSEFDHFLGLVLNPNLGGGWGVILPPLPVGFPLITQKQEEL